MKKLMIAALMMLGTSPAFAGDSEPLKAVLDAKDYKQAVQLLNQNLSQLANAQEKARPTSMLPNLPCRPMTSRTLFRRTTSRLNS